MTCKISVYLDTGVVCEYDVASADKGREHAAAIIKTGFRSTSGDDLEWYPPHRIDKVKVSKGAESTKYKDTKRAT